MGELAFTQRQENGLIGSIHLDRPEARNALNETLLTDARAAVGQMANDKEVRVVLLTGEGPSFCAGMDLKAVRNTPEKMGHLLMLISQLLREIRRLRQPTIAAVRGAAVGGGCGLMSVCDFSISHAEARLGYPEVDLGVCPAVVAPWLIKRLGAGAARRVLLAGGTMNGGDALRVGLLSNLVENADEVWPKALELAIRLSRGGPKAQAATKHWLNELDGSLEDAVLDEAAAISARIVQSEEAQSRLARLFEAGS